MTFQQLELLHSPTIIPIRNKISLQILRLNILRIKYIFPILIQLHIKPINILQFNTTIRQQSQ